MCCFSTLIFHVVYFYSRDGEAETVIELSPTAETIQA